jgi:hypothetical protein
MFDNQITYQMKLTWLFSIHAASLLGKAKLGREISDGKNKISHKFLERKIK